MNALSPTCKRDGYIPAHGCHVAWTLLVWVASIEDVGVTDGLVVELGGIVTVGVWLASGATDAVVVGGAAVVGSGAAS